MKTDQKDRFWRWFGFFFAASIAACFVVVFVLIEFRTFELEAVAAEALPAEQSSSEAWWVTPPYYPAFQPW